MAPDLQRYSLMHTNTADVNGFLTTAKQHADDVWLVLLAFDGVLADYGPDPSRRSGWI